MERHYKPIRPSVPAGENDSRNSVQTEPEGITKRPAAVTVACDSCRRKKIRCDGQRPVCSNCIGGTSQCSYRDQSGLSRETTKQIVHVIQTLCGLPAAEALQVISSLNGESDASIILSTLRNKSIPRNERIDNVDAASTSSDTLASLEFESQNPIAYPHIPPFNAKEIEWEPYRGLFESSRYGSARSSTQTEAAPRSSESHDDVTASPPLLFSPKGGYRAGDQAETIALRLCDPRLEKLNIRRWTNIGIDDNTAARCISFYLETDHPLLGHFDPESFLTDLISGGSTYCSSLLVNALLYWACQLYSSVDSKVDTLAISFCKEAERLWKMERNHGNDSIMSLAATEFLCLGYLGHGRDHAILAYVSEASKMGARMGLFGVDTRGDTDDVVMASTESEEFMRAQAHVAWGVFNWIILMSLFYRQPGLDCPKYPPHIAIPEYKQSEDSTFIRDLDELRQPLSRKYMGNIFAHSCRLWSILHEVSVVYYGGGLLPWGSGGTLALAEFKFRELLAWSNTLPSRIHQRHKPSQHVQVLHVWLHTAILDIFLPFVQDSSQGKQPLRTFSSSSITPEAVSTASVTQLKHLITKYRLEYTSSGYTILWHTALIYVINAVLNGAKDGSWYSDLLLCVYAYESLGRSWRVAAIIAKGLLSLIVQKSDVPSRTARRILLDLEKSELKEVPGEIRATFMGDLNLALLDPGSASVEHLAGHFEETMMLKDYTTILDKESRG